MIRALVMTARKRQRKHRAPRSVLRKYMPEIQLAIAVAGLIVAALSLFL